MTITQEKISNLLSKVNIELKKEDYEPQVKKQLKTLGKQVSIKGFRPGMVPTDMVKKMYGNSVLAEELNKLLNDEIYKYINESKIDIIASPVPSEGQKLDIDIYNIKDISFEYEIGHAPEISLAFLENGSAFNKYKIQVEEKMIDEEVDRHRKRFATYEYPETIEENDILSFTIEELNGEGQVKEGGINTVSSIMVDLLKVDVKKQVLGLKKQDSFETNVFEMMDREREAIAKNVLNMNDLSGLENVGSKFKLTLNNITRSKPAEFNEEFFVKLFGDNGAKNEEEMRATIKGDLESYFDGQTDSYLVNDIYTAVVDGSDMPLPDEFLKRWISVTSEKPVTPEEIESDYPQFAKSLKWSLIQRKVVSEQNLEVTDDEVHQKVRMNVIQQLYSYGLRNMGEDWVEQFVQKQTTDKKVVSQTRDELISDKVLNHLKSIVKLNEKPISLEDFKKMTESANAEG
jgi:trigger factor